MFTPLRYQVTYADCYPTSILNALVWLFARDELPGAALQRIYAYCLDGIERGVPGAYTTEHASLALVDWLDEFKTCSFAVTTEVIKGHEVHLRASSEVLRWLRRGGVAVLDIRITAVTTHSITQPQAHQVLARQYANPALFLRPARGARRGAHSAHQAWMPAFAGALARPGMTARWARIDAYDTGDHAARRGCGAPGPNQFCAIRAALRRMRRPDRSFRSLDIRQTTPQPTVQN